VGFFGGDAGISYRFVVADEGFLMLGLEDSGGGFDADVSYIEADSVYELFGKLFQLK
jgi:hypothetical protein